MSEQTPQGSGQDQESDSRHQAPHEPVTGAASEPGAYHPARSNQHQHEAMPASREADRNGAGSSPARPAAGHGEHDAAKHGGPGATGDAVRDMMGGPPPQGDAPDAPGVQIAAVDGADGEDAREGRVRHVANAVPGKPDGEVDTRS